MTENEFRLTDKFWKYFSKILFDQNTIRSCMKKASDMKPMLVYWTVDGSLFKAQFSVVCKLHIQLLSWN